MQGVTKLTASQIVTPEPGEFSDVFQNKIPLEDAKEDSPMFRKRVRDAEQDIEDLSQTLKRLVNNTRRCQQAASNFEECFRTFIDDLSVSRKVLLSNSADEVLEKGFTKFTGTLKEISNFRVVLYQQMEALLATPISEFISQDIKGLKDHSKKYEKAINQYDSALLKLGQVKKKNSSKVVEVEQELSEAKKNQVYSSLEYIYKINELNARKKFEFGERLAVFMYSQQAFFHQGSELFRDTEPQLRKYSAFLQSTRKNYENEKLKLLQQKEELEIFAKNGLQSSSPSPSITSSAGSTSPSVPLIKKGWLIKKSEDVLNSWHRRYFVLKDSQLHYYKTGEEARPDFSFNLLLSTVKTREDLERRCCFEIVSPNTSFILQAESQEQMHEWITALQTATSNALNAQSLGRVKSLNLSSGSSVLKPGLSAIAATKTPLYILRNANPANCICADCESKDNDIQWVSINLGVILCIDCSGVHRSLGVHISKIRSLSLDKWEPSTIELLLQLGNERVNKIFEAEVPSYYTKPTPQDNWEARLRWIKDKYVKRVFVNRLLNGADDSTKLNENLLNACEQDDVTHVLHLLAQGAFINFQSTIANSRGAVAGSTPLQVAVISDQPLVMELLLISGSNAELQNSKGETALHLAVKLGLAHIAGVLLLKCSFRLLTIQDRESKTPLDVAVESGQADCVTLLRLAQLARDEDQSNFEESFGEALKSFSRDAQLKGKKSV